MLYHKKLVIVRTIEKKDIDFIFYLNNEQLVRANSFNSKPISYKDHKEWFKHQFEGNNSLFFILENKNIPIGQVRFDFKKNHSIIGISISEKFRGKGFAIKGLTLAVEEYFNNNSLPIYAYIKKSNTASVRLFKKTGFVYLKDENVNNNESFIYKKGKN